MHVSMVQSLSYQLFEGDFIEILIDYLRFTSKIHNWVDLAEMLGLQKVEWEQGKARDGWLCHEFFGGIHLYHGGRDDAGVELSGAGCRMLETCNGNSFDWIGLFSYIREQGDEMNVSRLDVAGDDKSGGLNLDRITQQTRQRKYICKARRCVWMAGDEEEVIFGASSSSTRLRIYNKALERGVPGPWVRVEFQLRDEAADSFLANLLAREGRIGETYGGVLLNYLRYTTSVPGFPETNYNRLDTVGWWDKFVGTAQKIKNIKVGGLEYNYFNLESFVIRQCAGALKAYVDVHGGDVGPLLEVISKARLSKKHEELLRQLRMEEKHDNIKNGSAG